MSKRGRGAAASQPAAGRGRKKTQEPSPSPSSSGAQPPAPAPAAAAAPQRDPITELTDKLAAERTSNVTDETVREFLQRARVNRGELEVAKKAMRSANATLRSTYKEAKKAGVDVDALIWTLDNEKREPADIEREMRARARLARIAGLPIGTQLKLMFVDEATGESVAAAVDRQQLDGSPAPEGAPTDSPAGYTEEAGFRASLDGKKADANPHPAGTKPHAVWHEGWMRGQAQLVAEMSRTPPGATVQ